MARTVEKGRSAETGQFVPIDYAKKHPKTTVVEKVKVCLLYTSPSPRD